MSADIDDPGQRVEQATERVRALARTWLAWDGRPYLADDGVRVYTPHQAVRLYADHLVDHRSRTDARAPGHA